VHTCTRSCAQSIVLARRDDNVCRTTRFKRAVFYHKIYASAGSSSTRRVAFEYTTRGCIIRAPGESRIVLFVSRTSAVRCSKISIPPPLSYEHEFIDSETVRGISLDNDVRAIRYRRLRFHLERQRFSWLHLLNIVSARDDVQRRRQKIWSQRVFPNLYKRYYDSL